MQFGDTVKIKENPDTIKIGVQGKIGQIYGWTEPSVSGAKVIGTLQKDFAYNVYVEQDNQDFWFPEEYLEFIDHGAGTEVSIGNSSFIRNQDGEWVEQDK